ncbi:MAG: MBL fold metallo-hydrolase [Myxococcaceae bacterium]|nr:MBL fold metallo-hydrolase [Myxococcaceae bacterium]
MKKLRVVLVVLVGLALVVKFALLTARGLPEKARFTLDLAALRQAAGPQEAGPVSVRAEKVADQKFPGPLVVAGSAFEKLTFGFYGWQLAYADGTSVVLDPVNARPESLPAESTYDDAAWTRQEAALSKASVIAVTHEHYDHLGGAAQSAHFDGFGAKLKLTAAQRRKAPFGGVARDLSGPATLESGAEGSLHPVAPGVVAVTAAGHTPGSQMLYVRQAGGAEFLLVGDIAWQELALEKESTRARLVSLAMGEDDEAIVHQLRAIKDFKKANPTVDVVVAHDIAAMERRFASGAVGKGYAEVQAVAPPAPVEAPAP